MKKVFPNYDNCLTNLTNSILQNFNIKPYHKTLPIIDKILEEDSYDNIVLLIYDGMGSKILKNNLCDNSFLIKHKIDDIYAVFPPTTTASTTTLKSGQNPSEHGWLGWDLYFKEIDETITLFLNTIKDTEIPISKVNIAKKYFPYKNIVNMINEKYKAYSLIPFGEERYEGLKQLNEKIINLCIQKDKKFIYAYYDEPDHIMHETGTTSNESKNIIESINNSTKELFDSLKGTNTLIIVTADHGHINCKDITLSNYKDIFNTLKHDISIESRACSFFIKDNKKEEFEVLFQKYFSKDFILYKKEEVIKNKLFGPGKENEYFKDSLGDYLAVATSNKYFRYNEKSVKLVSMHGGITKDEMIVPLIILKTKGD